MTTCSSAFDVAQASRELAERLRAGLTAASRPAARFEPLPLDELHAQNRLPFTASQHAEMHRRTGYTLGNVPPADLDEAMLHACAPEANAFAQALLDGERPRGLVITGEPGRGKTFTACAVMRCVMDDMSVGLATDAELVREAKVSFDSRSRVTETAVVERFCAPQLLVLDDFGKAAYASQWTAQLVFEVVDRRIRQRKSTIVTTQYDAARLRGRLTVDGDDATAKAVVSRLGMFATLRIDGPDRRRR